MQQVGLCTWALPIFLRWFSTTEDDKQIERDLELNGEPGPAPCMYRLNILTGSVRGAGTDANVYITIVGEKGRIDKKSLESSKANFERGRLDVFGVSTTDMGEIKYITIGHDGRGFGAGISENNVTE